jgi:hypothetical protein
MRTVMSKNATRSHVYRLIRKSFPEEWLLNKA